MSFCGEDRMKNMTKFLSIFLITINLSSCILFQKSDITEELFPRDTEVPGWRTVDQSLEFNADNLHEYIKENGKAALFKTYNLKELFVVKYKNISNPNNEITIEIFFMNTRLNAFGIYSMERPENSTEESLCSSTYLSGRTIFSQKGNYYLKINTNLESTEDIKIFSKIICDKIKDNNPLPRYLLLFEKYENRKSLVYWIDTYSEFPLLKDIFSRKVKMNGKEKTVFFAKRDSAHISAGEFSNLIKNKKLILSNAGDSQTAFLKFNDNTFIFISLYKEWIFGIMDAESMTDGEKNINFLNNDLREFLEKAR
jgi:hypothetical protein